MDLSFQALLPWFGILALFVLVDGIKVIFEIWNRPQTRAFETDLSKVTALIATHNGKDVISETIKDLFNQGLPPEHILVIDDGSGDCTASIVRDLGVRLYSIPQMGKVSAINFGIQRVKTEYVLLLDDDTRVGGASIPTSLLEEFDAVAFNVIPDRRDRYGPRGSNLPSSIQRYEYCKSMEIGRRFQDGAASIACVSGAIGLFRRERLQLHHHEHSGAFEGEDLERTLIEHLFRGEVVFADEAVWTVVPDNTKKFLRQRLLFWYPAHYHMFLNYWKLLVMKHVKPRLRYEMAYNIFVILFDPFRVFSLFVLFYYMQWMQLGILYFLYLFLEAYPFRIIQKKMDTGKRLRVFLLYPLYNLSNLVLRQMALVVWVWKRFVSKRMKPKTEEDREWWVSPEK